MGFGALVNSFSMEMVHDFLKICTLSYTLSCMQGLPFLQLARSGVALLDENPVSSMLYVWEGLSVRSSFSSTSSTNIQCKYKYNVPDYYSYEQKDMLRYIILR